MKQTDAKSGAVIAIEQKMKTVPAGSYRHLLLSTARDFKNAWVDLGHHLTKVRDQSLYTEWGYGDFETYCQRELHLRKTTAHKLTATYAFMERHEPKIIRETLEGDRSEHIPPFEVVEVLSKAETEGRIGSSDYSEMRDRIFDVEKPPTPAGLKKMLNESFPPEEPEPPLPEDEVKKLARAARKLADGAVGCEAVSPSVSERAEALAEDFEEMVRRLTE